MKNIALFCLIISLNFLSYGQENNSVAVDDMVDIRMGETITFNPILNDYNTAGEDIIIYSCKSSSVEILSFTDSTITFKVPDYFLYTNPKLSYKLDTIWSPITNGLVLLNQLLQIDTLKCNRIKATIYPQNVQFWDVYFPDEWENTNQFIYPNNELTSTIFSQSLWFGGKDQNGYLHLAAERYRQNGADFWSGPLTTDGFSTADSTNSGKWFRTWKVTKTEVIAHLNNYQNPNYQMPEAIETWPAHGDIQQTEFLAPFVDVDLDMEYHPENGDYPLIKGDESIFYIYNDALEHSETDGLPIGVEIHCMAWAYEEARGKDALNNTIFMSYKFFNRSINTYYDSYIGIFTNFDLGNAHDDFVGCHVENGNYYVYNGQEYDSDYIIYGDTISWGYHYNIPTQGICILGGPYIDDDNIDNPLGDCNESINGAGFGDGIIDNERYGMTGFVYHNNGGSNHSSDPMYANDYYNYIQGLWKDGSPRVYGGLGHPTTGGDSLFPSRFMWPGDSDPCHWGTGGLAPSWDSIWTEETTGMSPGDRRGTASMGPFTFEAGSVHYLDLALVTAPGDENKNSKDLLQEYVAQIKQDYLLNSEEFGNQYLSIAEETKKVEELYVYPNPADGDIIRFELSNNQRATYFIYNATGQIMEQGELAVQKNHSLNIGHLPSGWYILEVKTNGQVLYSKLIL